MPAPLKGVLHRGAEVLHRGVEVTFYETQKNVVGRSG